MKEFIIRTMNEDETISIAERLARRLTPGSIVTLEGDLGVGKTTFTKGIARGLGVDRTVTSPTFTIIKEYMGKEIPLYHVDAYRLEGSDDDIGLEEYFYGEGISVIEWAQFIQDFLPDQRLEITLKYIDEQARSIQFVPHGHDYKEIIEQFMVYDKD